MALLLCIPLFACLALLIAVWLCAKVKRSGRSCGCIIVLGAKVHPDGRMSRSLEYRCEAALAAWQRGVAPAIIVCGGVTGEAPRSEAAIMRAWMLEHGIPAEAVISEDQSRNTVENLKNAKVIMAERGFADAAIVTSDYHVQRAIWIARKFSIRACGIPARSPEKAKHRLKSLLRECVSWVVFWYYELTLGRRGTPGASSPRTPGQRG